MAKKFLTENHSPYFLHPLEGPGALITAGVFYEKIYDLWEKAMRNAFKGENKLGCIEGPLKKPILEKGDDALEMQAWEMTNSMICSWILNITDPKLRPSIAYVEQPSSCDKT